MSERKRFQLSKNEIANIFGICRNIVHKDRTVNEAISMQHIKAKENKKKYESRNLV